MNRYRGFCVGFPGVARTPLPKRVNFAPDMTDEAMRRGHAAEVQWQHSPWGGVLHDRRNNPVPGKFSGKRGIFDAFSAVLHLCDTVTICLVTPSAKFNEIKNPTPAGLEPAISGFGGRRLAIRPRGHLQHHSHSALIILSVSKH